MPGHFQFRWLALVAVMLGIMIVFVPSLAKPVQAAVVVIDSFNTTQTYNVDPGGSTGLACVTGSSADIIGTNREVAITIVSSPGAPNGTTVSANAGGAGAFGFSQDSQVTSTATLTYDGDCTTGVNNPTGLGGADLTQAGTQYAIILAEIAADLDTSISIRVYTDADECSVLTQALPPLNSQTSVPRAITFLYSAFVDDGLCPLAGNPSNPSVGPANFASVGAIQVILDGTSNPASDITLDFIQTPPMDFGDLPAGGIYPNYSAITLLGTPAYPPNGGAAHIIVATHRIGTLEDDECDGQPTGFASGDDTHTGFLPNSCTPADGIPAINDDEDGVTGDGTDWTVAGSHSMTVLTTTPLFVPVGTVTSGGGCLSVWIDWNRDGDFADTSERVANGTLVSGSNTATIVSFTRPAGVTAGALYVRVRLFASLSGDSTQIPPFNAVRCPSGSSSNTVDGQFTVGEVEDYRFLMGVPTASVLSGVSAKAASTTKVRVTWETGNELTVVGFNVWRKQGKAGWQKRNVNLIPPQNPGSAAGASYKFADEGVKPKGKYKIEAIMTDGSSGWSDATKVQKK